MFGFFKSKERRLAEGLAHLATNVVISDQEKQIVSSCNIDFVIYEVEIVCLQIYSVISALIDWTVESRVDGDVSRKISSEFFSIIGQWCNNNSPNKNLFEHVKYRVAEYDEAEKIDIHAFQNDEVRMDLPAKIVSNLISKRVDEVPYELMPQITHRHHIRKDGAMDYLMLDWKKL